MKKHLKKEGLGLVPNRVDARTLFVGVGGIGSTIVQKVAGKCSPQEMKHVAFVCMDTNVNDLSELTNQGASVYAIQTSTTQTVGSYLDNDKDAFENWFPNNTVMYAKTVSEGAGQVRAISRLALNASIKTGRIQPLFDAIDDLFRKEGDQFSQALRVCMVSSASGGTGSGMILPLSMLIRDYISEKYPLRGAIVRMLLLLPETLDSVITSPVERESQRRNAYATVKEINAFMMNASGFCKIGGKFDRYNSLHIDVPIAGTKEYQSLSSLPCDFCFLLDGQNAKDETLISKGQYEEFAAQTLYEQHIGPMMKEAFGQDDNIIKEMSDPEKLGRNRFGGIGASVIHYPYDSVVEYIAEHKVLKAMGAGSEFAGSWSQYDKEYLKEKQDAEKKGVPESEAPKIEESYVNKILTNEDRFSVDLKQFYQLETAGDRIGNYLDSLKEEMETYVENYEEILNSKNACPFKDGKSPNYSDPQKKGTAPGDLRKLNIYNRKVDEYAEKVAKSKAKAVFNNDLAFKLASEKDYMLESILKSGSGKVMHPNAARFMLYLLLKEMEGEKVTVEQTLAENKNTIKELTTKVDEKNKKFDIESTKGKVESSLQEYAVASVDAKKNEADKVNQKLSGWLKKFYSSIEEKTKAIAYLAALEAGCIYVREILTEYVRFFTSFDKKVEEIEMAQKNLVKSLEFKKGDSVWNVCCSKSILDYMAEGEMSDPGSEGMMLSSDLNAEIYDRLKANTAIAREQGMVNLSAKMGDGDDETYVFIDKRKDVFNDTVLDFFIKDLQKNCKSLDMNVLAAIEKEKEIQLQLDKKSIKEEQIPELVSRHIQYIIGKGMMLAQPGIQDKNSDYPRVIRACAFNEEFSNSRNYEVDKLFKKMTPVPCKSVSRYELHFFMSSYNLTLDQLPKFACKNPLKIAGNKSGIYHRAYADWTKSLGPDSTKGSKITTHIDKRWDSIAAMQEINFDYQDARMKEIHSAMVNGLVYEKIVYKKMSPLSDTLRVYQYENCQEEMKQLVVSNGTICDEFFEILDALYINPSIVADIEKMVTLKINSDTKCRVGFKTSSFYKALQELNVNDNGGEASSIFEIAMNYYNSLPNSLRYNSEISLLIDAIVEMICKEAERFENKIDARILSCEELVAQFNLLLDHYEKSPTLQANIKASENTVLDMIYRKIKTVLAGHDTVSRADNYDAIVAAMKKRLK